MYPLRFSVSGAIATINRHRSPDQGRIDEKTLQFENCTDAHEGTSMEPKHLGYVIVAIVASIIVFFTVMPLAYNAQLRYAIAQERDRQEELAQKALERQDWWEALRQSPSQGVHVDTAPIRSQATLVGGLAALVPLLLVAVALIRTPAKSSESMLPAGAANDNSIVDQ
jgi:hypothetical protein